MKELDSEENFLTKVSDHRFSNNSSTRRSSEFEPPVQNDFEDCPRDESPDLIEGSCNSGDDKQNFAEHSSYITTIQGSRPRTLQDISYSLDEMDARYSAVFSEWVKDESNIPAYLDHYSKIANSYAREQIALSLKWLITDWKLKSIIKVVKGVTNSWENPTDLGYIVKQIANRWKTGYVSELIIAILGRWPDHKQDNITKKIAFFKTLMFDWNFSRITDIFIKLDRKLEWEVKSSIFSWLKRLNIVPPKTRDESFGISKVAKLNILAQKSVKNISNNSLLQRRIQANICDKNDARSLRLAIVHRSCSSEGPSPIRAQGNNSSFRDSSAFNQTTNSLQVRIQPRSPCNGAISATGNTPPPAPNISRKKSLADWTDNADIEKLPSPAVRILSNITQSPN